MTSQTKNTIYSYSIIILTVVMIILRFLLNEKGRINPDSIRFMRFAHNFPFIDNTTTPTFYPLSIKLVSFIGVDMFWSSKIVGIFSYIFIIFFAWKKKFYFRETLILCALFSFVSLFSSTMSEPLFLAFLFFYFYISIKILRGEFQFYQGTFWLTMGLLLLYNTRYTGLFYIGATGLFGLVHFKKSFGKIFMISAGIGVLYYILYKRLF